jgi:hypothetical protein
MKTRTVEVVVSRPKARTRTVEVETTKARAALPDPCTLPYVLATLACALEVLGNPKLVRKAPRKVEAGVKELVRALRNLAGKDAVRRYRKAHAGAR